MYKRNDRSKRKGGDRCSALQSDVKVGSRTYEHAKRVYDRILRGKTCKGYRIPQATITSQDGECIVAQLKLKAGQSEEEQKCD